MMLRFTFYILLTSFVFASCNSTPLKPTNFDFIEGSWKRTNDEDGEQTFEEWVKSNDSTFIGRGYTMQGEDTIWQEKLKLSPINGQWHYQVVLNGETKATNFKVIKDHEGYFLVENLNNDFPQHMEYQLKKRGLEAKIYNEEMSIEYNFIRK